MLFDGFRMPGSSFRGVFAPLTPEEQDIENYLKYILKILATDIGQRNLDHPGSLTKAAHFISQEFKKSGYDVVEHCYKPFEEETKNIIVEIPGGLNPHEIIIIGAHYDSALGSPGADDNASGVSALLQIAEKCTNTKFNRTLRFVAFTHEEPPYFLTPMMGSLCYAKQCRERNENIVAMISLESLGYYNEESIQDYPYPLGYFYPANPNFVGFVSNIRSRCLVKNAIAFFRRSTQFPSEGFFGPLVIPGIALSDHFPFWLMGYPAIMITDTAYLRNPYYHTKNDRYETINFPQMARVVLGLNKLITTLANIKTSPNRYPYYKDSETFFPESSK